MSPTSTARGASLLAAALLTLTACVAGQGPAASTQEPTTTTEAPSSPTPSPSSSSPTAAGSTTSTSTATTPPLVPVLTASPSPMRSKAAQTVTFALDSLPTGAPPGVAYYDHGVIYPAGGGQGTPIQRQGSQSVDAFAAYGDGWVTLYAEPGKLTTRIYDSAGNVVQSSPIPERWQKRMSFARGTDGWVAVSTQPGQITLVDATGATKQTWQIPAATSAVPVSVLPDHSVVLLAGGTGFEETVRAFPDGTFEGLTDQLVWDVNQQNGDLALRSDCALVLGVDPFLYRWASCPGRKAGSFSPGGQYLAMGSDARFHCSTPCGTYTVRIFDAATGQVLIKFDNPGPGRVTRTNSSMTGILTWEDDTHVLDMVWSQSTQSWYALRFGVDGTVEKVPTAPLVQDSWNDVPTFELPY